MQVVVYKHYLGKNYYIQKINKIKKCTKKSL